jgi:hypothetical protein
MPTHLSLPEVEFHRKCSLTHALDPVISVFILNGNELIMPGRQLTPVVTAIRRIKIPADDDFMLNFRFRLDRQLKSFIPSLIFSHSNSIYLENYFVVAPAF